MIRLVAACLCNLLPQVPFIFQVTSSTFKDLKPWLNSAWKAMSLGALCSPTLTSTRYVVCHPPKPSGSAGKGKREVWDSLDVEEMGSDFAQLMKLQFISWEKGEENEEEAVNCKDLPLLWVILLFLGKGMSGPRELRPHKSLKKGSLSLLTGAWRLCS